VPLAEPMTTSGEPQLLVPLLERHHRAVALAREFDGALKRAIVTRTVLSRCLAGGAQSAHPSLRANDHGRFVFQVVENTAASSTAAELMDTALAATRVSLRTRLATEKDL